MLILSRSCFEFSSSFVDDDDDEDIEAKSTDRVLSSEDFLKRFRISNCRASFSSEFI